MAPVRPDQYIYVVSTLSMSMVITAVTSVLAISAIMISLLLCACCRRQAAKRKQNGVMEAAGTGSTSGGEQSYPSSLIEDEVNRASKSGVWDDVETINKSSGLSPPPYMILDENGSDSTDDRIRLQPSLGLTSTKGSMSKAPGTRLSAKKVSSLQLMSHGRPKIKKKRSHSRSRRIRGKPRKKPRRVPARV